MTSSFMKCLPFRLKTFGYSRPKFFIMVLAFNSPLKLIFSKGILQLSESGAMGYFATKWKGRSIESTGGSDFVVLSGGQVILIFIIFLSFFASVFLIYLFELLYKAYQKHKTVRNVQPSKQSNNVK